MHIKNIIINNFKSFHGSNIINGILPCHNVIVGNNGAGKSIFLQAIDFFFKFENKQPSKGNISNLLSQRETNGFIEVFFSGCVSPFDYEITIRKEFSLITNINFFVNGKRMEKKKIKVLYEALSLNYMHSSFLMTPLMVQKFITFSRKKLFDYLMKNMGATLNKTYEIIQNIFLVLEDQKEKIDYLFELFQDVNIYDGKNYFMLLKKHKKIKNDIIIEILRKKTEKLRKTITQLEGELSSLKGSNFDDSVSSTVSLLLHSYSQIESSLNSKQGILNNLIEEKCSLIEKKEKIQLSAHDITKEIFLMKKGMEEISEHSVKSEIEEKIKCISKELDIVNQEFVSKKCVLTELISQKQLKEEMRLNLLTKIQRTKDFQSKDERNSQLHIKVNLLSGEIRNLEGEINIFSTRKEELLNSKQVLNGKIENIKQKLQEQEESFGQNVFEAKQQLNDSLDSMCDIRRVEKVLEDKISEINLNIQEKGLQLKKKVGSAIVIGAESLLVVIEACKSSESYRWLSDNYYGMVIENIECPQELYIAVESAIGNRLFAHIVANKRTGTNILKVINQHKLAGELVFLPIDNLIENNYYYPLLDDAEPILNRMRYKPQVEKVMKYLFGHVLICKTINTAISIMKKIKGIICVTLEGDKVSKSVISGGYINKTKCSKTLFLEINHLQETYSLKTEELKFVQNKINELEATINRYILQSERLKKKYSNTEMKENLNRLIDDEEQVIKELKYINGLIKNKKDSIKKCLVSHRMLNEEMSEDFEEINEKGNAEVMLLNKEIEECENILKDKNLEQTKLECKKSKLENDLSHQKKLKDLLELDSFEIKTYTKKLEDYYLKENIIDNRIRIITKKIKDTEEAITASIINKLKLEEDIKEYSDLDASVGRRDKITRKIIQYNNKFSEYKAIYNKINKFSSLSTEYSEFTLPMLYNELKNVNRILKSVLQNSEIEKRKKKITGLYKKYEQLHNCFSKNYILYSHFVDWFHSHTDQCLNKVSDNFSEIFRSLTSKGDANLFLDNDESSERWPALENVTGLQMCIQFPSTPSTWNLSDLSFSQSLLVTLAFKLSIIRSLFIPFCILDEIDRPLEDNQKKLVSLQISDLEGQVQTFSASHSQEWIKLGKDVYHVTFKYTGSSIKKLTKDEIVHFLNERLMLQTESYSFGSAGWDTSSLA